MLRIDAAAAARAGVAFYAGNDKIWLADQVPPRFIAPLEAESPGSSNPAD